MSNKARKKRAKMGRVGGRIAASAKHETPKDLRATLTASAEIIQAAAADGGGVKIRIVAYNGGAMNLDFFDLPVVIDLASMEHNAKMPIITDHRTRSLENQIGVGATREENGKIIVEGVIAPDTRLGAHVIALGKVGAEPQASVGGPSRSYEEYGAGESVTVNGKQFDGPLYVARGFRIQETSMLVLGADGDTEVSIAARIALGKDSGMNFEAWLKAAGFNPDTLTEDQTKSLRAMFDAGKQPPVKATGKEAKETGEAPATKTEKKVEASGAKKGVHDAGDEHEDADPVADIRAKSAEEIKRIAAVREVCGGKHPAIEAEAVEKGWTRDATELAVIKAERQSVNISTGGGGGGPEQGKVIEAALCRSSGMNPEKLVKDYGEKVIEASDSMRGAGIQAAFYEAIAANGGYVRPGHFNEDTIRAAFEAERRIRAASGVGFSTVSLSGILGNVANKVLLSAYARSESAAVKFCRETDAKDFKQMTSYRLGSGGSFLKVGPGGELKHMTFSEQSFTNQVDTFGRAVGLTRQMIINDDLRAFTQIPEMIGHQAFLAREEAVFTLLLANTGTFFGSGNNNYIEGGTTTLTIDGFTQLEQKFLDQVDDNGKPILVTPKLLVVPTSLKSTAEQLMSSLELREGAASKAPSKNPHAGKATVVATPYLNSAAFTGNSATAWYLWADPFQLAAMEIAYLQGRRAPTIESGEVDFTMLGMAWRGYFDFGVAFQDPRGAAKSKGAA